MATKLAWVCQCHDCQRIERRRDEQRRVAKLQWEADKWYAEELERLRERAPA